MKKFSFFLMNEKGYMVLCGLIANNKKRNIDCVIGASDKNVKKDFFNEIKGLCAKEGISFYDRADSFVLKSNYKVAI